MLEVKVENCAGIDVGKKFLAVCVLAGPADRKPVSEVRRFGTSVKELERLRAWLSDTKCREAVMESTGSYWKPVFNILEGSLKCTLKGFIEVSYLPLYKGKWKPSTAMTNEDRINHHILDALGERQMRSIAREELQALLDSKAKLSFSTVDHLRWDLSQMFNMAVAEGVITKNPATLLYTPRDCSRPERRTMTLKEVKKHVTHWH